MMRYLAARTAGCSWAIPLEAVDSVGRSGRDVRIRLKEGSSLCVDAIIGRFEAVPVPVGSVLGRFLPAWVDGLVLLGSKPAPVVNPGRPPEMLRCPETPAAEEEA